MEVLHPRCAGLDVHKDSVVACVRIAADGTVKHEVRTFGTMTTPLEELAAWLRAEGCTHAAMEATGVYWKPVWHALEDELDLVLANAAHIKNVPGRKTDVNDATWIADLLAHGLIRGSFVPEASIQDLRALTRTRKQFVREKVGHVQRIQKTLEDGNIKIASVASDIMGVSGRAILEALIAGETDPDKLADRASGRLKASRATIVESLRGRVTANHRLLLRLHFDQVKAIEEAIATVDKEVDALIEPFRTAADRLSTIPGISDVVAEVIVSEIGVDMSRFPTPGQLISWAGLCPRNDESAGKRRSTRLRKGAPWLKTALVQAAWAASRAKKSYLSAQFFRIKGRRGARKAIMAVAASMLTAVYFMLRDGVDYRDLGHDYFDRVNKAKTAERLVRRLNDLGYQVDLKAAA
ncbi:MAG TPA: IS110 family transposase [Dermatophilaceae bacterium]|nr:IS110 family transposase [Dermatophilaceae bacterium]